MEDRYDEMLRQLGLKTLTLLEMHVDSPAEFTPQYVFERLAGSYLDIANRFGGWPEDDE